MHSLSRVSCCWGSPKHAAAPPSVSTVLHAASPGPACCHACFIVCDLCLCNRKNEARQQSEVATESTVVYQPPLYYHESMKRKGPRHPTASVAQTGLSGQSSIHLLDVLQQHLELCGKRAPWGPCQCASASFWLHPFASQQRCLSSAQEVVCMAGRVGLRLEL